MCIAVGGGVVGEMDRQACSVRFQPGKRYLVKRLPGDAVSEVLVLEVSPQGRVKVKDLLDGRVLWWSDSQLEDILILEELSGGGSPLSGDMHWKIVRD